MLSWLKQFGAAIIAAGLMFLGFMAVAKSNRHKAKAEKLEQRATQDINRDVQAADKALKRAKIHAEKAETIKSDAEAKIDAMANKDEDMGDIISRWKRTQRMRDYPT